MDSVTVDRELDEYLPLERTAPHLLTMCITLRLERVHDLWKAVCETRDRALIEISSLARSEKGPARTSIKVTVYRPLREALRMLEEIARALGLEMILG